MNHRPPAERIVLDCVTGAATPAQLEVAGNAGLLTEVLARARDHQVTAYLQRALRTATAVPRGAEAVDAWLRSAATATAMRQLRAMADLRQVSATLARAALPWLVMKGPVLAERVYPEPSLRPSRDLDVVVPADRFAAAVEALEAAGAHLLDANWDLAIRGRRSQLHVRLPHGTTMDLHWHLINAGHVRDALDVAMPSLWRELRTVAVRDLHVATLSVTDTIVHLGVHAALGGAWRLRWLNDLALAIDHETVDWASVVARAGQWRARRLLGVALMRSARLLGADVPGDVLAALAGSHRSHGWAAAFDRRWSPMAATAGSPTLARLWPQFVRDSWPDTVRAMGWRVRRRAGNGLRGFRHGRERPEMMTPSGTGDGRARYLRLVTSGALDGARPDPVVIRAPVGARSGR